MRLCFLYKDTYAPYSKWFGTAFNKLNIYESIKTKINAALQANDLTERENNLVEAQALYRFVPLDMLWILLVQYHLMDCINTLDFL